MKALKLKSGNLFYYFQGFDIIETGIVITPDHQFMGAYLGEEAKRKFKCFSRMSEEVKVDTILVQDFVRGLNFDKYIDFNPIAYWVKEAINYWVRDLYNCDGTTSCARSCADRRYYYFAVGMGAAYDSDKSFNLGLFVANHISLFGPNAKKLFFGDYDQADEYARGDFKTRYFDGGFKCPSYYFRQLLQYYKRREI